MRTDHFAKIQKIKLELSGTKPIVHNMEAYPWEQCIADQTEKYGDEETAAKVCGAIKANMKTSFAEGDSLDGACWPGYEAIGMKDKDGRMVPNCVPIKEQQQSKQEFVIPDPQADEDQNTYVSRCIGDINAEYPGDQGIAICEGKWRDRNKQQ
jgi:hypothetical protein